MYSIYLIVNHVNNFVYVGQTCKSVYARFSEHRNRAKVECNRPLYHAMLTYGFNNFSVQELETNLTKEEANEREIFYICKYNSYIGNVPCCGYNATLGGDAGSYNAKYVVQVDNNLNVVNIFSSTHDAGRYLGKHNAHISECCLGKRPYAYGYFWIYLKDFEKLRQANISLKDYFNDLVNKLVSKNDLKTRIVVMTDLVTKQQIEFVNKTNKEIEGITGIDASLIGKCLNGVRKSTCNKTFNYK